MEFLLNPNTKRAEKPQSSISSHPISDVPYQNYVNSQVRANRQVHSAFYHHCPSRLVSGIHTSISLNSLWFYLSRMLVDFSLTCIFQGVGIIFQFMVFTFLKNALNLFIFTHAAVPHSKFQVEFFENLFPSKTNVGFPF